MFKEVEENYIYGKDVILFLFGKVKELIDGKSFEVNIEFVKYNVLIGM